MKTYRLGLSVFFLALLYCGLLAAGNLFIYEQQKQTLYEDITARQSTELQILSDLTREGLVTQNYSFIDWLFKRWGQENSHVLAIDLESTQGFSLLGYERRIPAQSEVLQRSKRISLYDGSYLVTISSDTAGMERKLYELLIQLFLISTGATMLLIFLLWFLFYKFAFQPLSEEVRLRKKIEQQLVEMRSTD